MVKALKAARLRAVYAHNRKKFDESKHRRAEGGRFGEMADAPKTAAAQAKRGFPARIGMLHPAAAAPGLLPKDTRATVQAPKPAEPAAPAKPVAEAPAPKPIVLKAKPAAPEAETPSREITPKPAKTPEKPAETGREEIAPKEKPSAAPKLDVATPVSAEAEAEASKGKQYKGAQDLMEEFHDKSVTADDIINATPGAREEIARAEANKANTRDTHLWNSLEGAYTHDRMTVHGDIIREMFSDEAVAKAKPKPGEKPTLIFLGGRGGSGKSWFTENVDSPVIKNAIVINNDTFKEALPEYNGDNAGAVHEEATAITTYAMTYAREMGLNVIYDATMKSPASNMKILNEFKGSDYRTEGYYMHTAPQIAAKRALGRYVKGRQTKGTGRYVPIEYVLGSTSNEKTFDTLSAHMDDWAVYNNNGDKPVLAVSKRMTLPKPKADEVDIQDNMSVTAKSDADKKQPVSTIDELYEKALATEPEFVNELETIADQAGAELTFTPKEFAEPGSMGLKQRSSAERKLKSEYKGDVTQLKDILRATILTKTVEESRQALATVIKTVGRDRIVTIKDRQAVGGDMDGYRDILVHYRTKNGLIAEVQLNSKNMLETKNTKGHKIYEDLRVLPKKGTGTVEEEAKRAKLEDASQWLYNTTYQKDGNGRWGRKGMVA